MFACTRDAGNHRLGQHHIICFDKRTLNLLVGRSSSLPDASSDILGRRQTDTGEKCSGDTWAAIGIKLFFAQTLMIIPTITTHRDCTSPDLPIRDRIGHSGKPHSLIFGRYPTFSALCKLFRRTYDAPGKILTV